MPSRCFLCNEWMGTCTCIKPFQPVSRPSRTEYLELVRQRNQIGYAFLKGDRVCPHPDCPSDTCSELECS